MRWLVALLSCTVLIARSTNLNPDREILARWPAAEPAVVSLLWEAGVNAVLVPPAADNAQFLAACRSAGIAPIAELAPAEGPEALRKELERVRAAGFAGAAIQAFGGERAFRAILDSQRGFVVLVSLTPEQIAWNVAPAWAVLKAGLWPGVQRRNLSEASATARPWLDANSHLVAYLRGWFPGRPALLGYRPDKEAGVSPDRILRPDSSELALADAFSAGGSVILSFPESFCRELLAGEKRALTAWRTLASSIAFVKKNRALLGGEPATRVAVAAGTLDESGEILNMLYRNNLCPVVFAAARVPALNTSRLAAVAAVNATPSGPSARNLTAFAGAGGKLFVSGEKPWWLGGGARKSRSDDDGDLYAAGQGEVFAYRSAVADPSEFALDVIDAINQKNLDLRLWTAESVLGTLHRSAEGKLVLALVNYGSPLDRDFLVYVRGRFRSAEFLEPASDAARPLQLTRRPQGVEINLRRLSRIALIVLTQEGV
jgi:hypothetical protein